MRKSTSYIMTVDVNSAVDMAQLATIKKAVTIANQNRSQKKRVVVRGRKPITKQAYHDFRTNICRVRGYDRGGNIVGGICNASKLDIYIYDRY